jgi:hypothetical protein
METVFAQVDSDGKVLNVIVADKDMIKILDQSLSHIQTWADANGTPKKRFNYARIGGKYLQTENAFIDPQPFNSWQLDASFQWQPPTPEPQDGKMYRWNEVSKLWTEVTNA